ncbi:T9SS type A sorting domain-containing protein [Phaeodactylibacter xiamenensis]|uniref:T9SS type A sorting domain-containing protein n=1 Tax=Phaeodactylibacter xiamenensis TaxID=1524460 RepID=UPI003BAB65C1
MKKTTYAYSLLHLLLAVTVVSLKAQDYSPLVIEQATWQIIAINGNVYTPFGYTIEGDTTIESVAYKKVYYLDLYPDTFSVDYAIEDRWLFGALREDTAARKVYTIIFDETWGGFCTIGSEFELYDFSKGIGDTISNCLTFPDIEYPYIIDAIDQEEVWGLNRTHIQTSQFGIEESLIEGIGYSGGLFVEALYLPSTADWGVFLHDYCVGAAADCGLLSSTASEKMLPVVRVFPNPVRQGEPLWLEKPEGIAAYHTVELVDAMGRVCIRQAYTPPADGQYLSTSGLAPGFYVLQFRSQDGQLLQVEKVIIE